MVRMSSVDRRLELVSAALRVIAAHGVAGATTRAIVAEAGMPLASFHYAFESRDEMMRELVSFVVENETLAVFESYRFGVDARTSIHAALSAYLETIAEDPTHELVMFELVQYALRTPGLDHLARDQWARYRSSIVSLLHSAEATLDIEWALPVDDVARIVLSFTDGITFAYLADHDLEGAERVVDFAADSLATLALPAHVISPARQKEHSA
jgi:AcrR family transcriptional regulator